MPSQSSTTSIQEPVELFGGVSLPSSTSVSARNHWTRRPGTFELTTVDHGLPGNAEFRTTVELTVDPFSQIPPSAMYRLACLYMVGHLSEPSLREAYQCLGDVYAWQVERASALPPKPSEQGFVKAVTPIRSLKRQPFTISDD